MESGKGKAVIRGQAMQEVEIKVRGEIDENWSDWFGRLNITHAPRGFTTLTGSIRDQAELRGILSRLADLGLELTFVNARPVSAPQFVSRGGD